MIIKSHIRGGYRDAASYLEDQGKNEKIRTVDISDFDALTLDDALKNMWTVAYNSKVIKALHHISINPCIDERLSDDQVHRIVERCEKKYGYKKHDHQRVIVEHIRKSRQHFHVMWNRVSLSTGQLVRQGFDHIQSIQVAREMEWELGLHRLGKLQKKPHHERQCFDPPPQKSTFKKSTSNKNSATSQQEPCRPSHHSFNIHALHPKQLFRPVADLLTQRPQSSDNTTATRAQLSRQPELHRPSFRRPEWEYEELLAWAWKHGRIDILTQFGIYLPPDAFET